MVVLVTACGSQTQEESSATGVVSEALSASGLGQIDVFVPRDVGLETVAVASTWGLIVHDNGRVLASDQGVAPVVVNRGLIAPQTWQNRTELKAQSSAPIVYSGIDAYVNSNAAISTLLYAPAVLPQAGANVPHWQSGTPEFVTSSRSIQFPALPSTWVSVERGQTQHLEPGSYGNYSIKEQAVLELTPGRYYLRSLGIEPNGTLRITGAAGGVFLYVMGDFTFRGVQAFEDPAQELMVVSFAQQVYLERPFQGVVMAPEGTLALGGTTGQTFLGQFFGALVEIRNGATVGLRPFSYGLWDDADECGWGRLPGSTCDYDVACPAGSSRRCEQGACTCLPAGSGVPHDVCSWYAVRPDGELRLSYQAAGQPCDPAFTCSGTGSCDGRGYCECHGASLTDSAECTEPVVGASPLTLRPRVDGTPCGSYSGTCTVQPTCSGGVCDCGQSPQPPPGEAPSCPVIGAPCAGYHCLQGTCDADFRCQCDLPASLPMGTPIRIGTQNVHALPSPRGTKFAAGCDAGDFVCEARLMAEKIRQSNYDVIALNEAFDEDYADEMVAQLYPDPFPYVVKSLGGDAGLGGMGVNSGLMLFSRWPFADADSQDGPCFGQYPGTPSQPMSVLGEDVTRYDPSSLGLVGREVVTKAVHFWRFQDRVGPDASANKGLGHARLLAPGGTILEVFFSHTQAHDKSLWAYISNAEVSDWDQYLLTEPAREAQCAKINEIISCVMAPRTDPNDIAILLGDLNVNGDLSNPSSSVPFMANHPLLGCETVPCQLWDDPVETRNEWDFHYNWTGATPNVNAAGLFDTWAFTMTPGCVPAWGSDWPNDKCRVTNPEFADNLVSYQSGTVTFDRGASQSLEPNGQERLDYILLGERGLQGPYYPQHVSRAYNLLKGNAGPSSFLRAIDAVNALAGADPITDHYGLNLELDASFDASGAPVDKMNPGSAQELPPDTKGTGAYFEATLPYDTAVHWYKISTPGDYVFSVSPKNQLWSGQRGPDNGITFQVFENTDLSAPMAPHEGEIMVVEPRIVYGHGCVVNPDGCIDKWTLPGFRQGKFKSIHFPLYIKVFATDKELLRATSRGKYLLQYHRASCTSPEEACTMLPYETNLGDHTTDAGEVDTTPERVTLAPWSGEAWFAFHLDEPDGPRAQSLRFFAAEEVSNPRVIDSVALVASDGSTILDALVFTPEERLIDNVAWRVWEIAPERFGTLEHHYRSGLGKAEGTKYYLRILQLPSSLVDAVPNQILVGWETNLTWLYGSELGGPPCILKCEDTQEVGHDEIYMKVGPQYDQNEVMLLPDNVAEATHGVKIGDIDEVDTREWTGRFFAGLTSVAHPGGTSYQKLPAINFTEELRIEIHENDSGASDETEWTYYSTNNVGLATAGLSPRQTLVFPDTIDDGEYKLSACTLSRTLQPMPCESNADCDVDLVCVGKTCRTH